MPLYKLYSYLGDITDCWGNRFVVLRNQRDCEVITVPEHIYWNPSEGFLWAMIQEGELHPSCRRDKP